jgi:hypothetical protein
MTTGDDKTEEKQKGGGIGWFSWTFMAMMLYVLSIGPAALLSKKHFMPDRVGEILYAPLIWLADNTPLDTPLEFYVDLWIGEKPNRGK